MLIFVIDTFFRNPIKESLKPTFISAHITWYPAEMLIYVTSCIFWANVKFRHWYFFLKPNHRKPAPSHVKISHDIQQKTSSTLHSTYFEPMVMFVIDTFLRNPITESLKPTFICWNITWHPAETSIYFIFRIFWANVNFCHWYFFFFTKPNQRKPETHLCQWAIALHGSVLVTFFVAGDVSLISHLLGQTTLFPM